MRSGSNRKRLPAGFVLLALFLSACDGYVEQVSVEADGSVSFAARATVVCADELQVAMWDAPPCDVLDAAVAGDAVAGLPFDFVVDQARVSLVSDGELDRRRIDAGWEGSIDEMQTLLVSGGSTRALGEERVEATFSPSGTPLERFRASEELAPLVQRSFWPAAEFRVVAPSRVVEHNGDAIAGRTVTWTLDGDEPDVFRLVWSTDERGIRYWWWMVGAGILSLVLFLMLKLEA